RRLSMSRAAPNLERKAEAAPPSACRSANHPRTDYIRVVIASALSLSPLATATQPDSEQFRSSPRTLPIRPSKVRLRDIYLAPGGDRASEPKPGYEIDGRVGSGDGFDHPSSQDGGGGCAKLVSVFPPSLFPFFLGGSTSFLPPPPDARQRSPPQPAAADAATL